LLEAAQSRRTIKLFPKTSIVNISFVKHYPTACADWGKPTAVEDQTRRDFKGNGLLCDWIAIATGRVINDNHGNISLDSSPGRMNEGKAVGNSPKLLVMVCG
jgi:hypothetical protein